MARNGSGTFSRIYNWVNDRNAAIKVNASRMDDEIDGIATALSESIARDGQTTTTAAIPFAAGINTNTISERTAAAGVTIDSVLLKDGAVSATASSTITSTDAGATEGPDLTLYRNSASPAASDVIGGVVFDGEDSAGNTQTYGRIRGVISDPTSTSEDGQVAIRTVVAGTEADRVIVGQGVQIGSPTGGDQGAGTLNLAGNLFINGGRAGRVAQVVNTQTGIAATGTTTIPFDNTTPQITEGDQYMTLAITPTNASSTLIIDVGVNMSHSASSRYIAALFQDATANALAAATTSATAATVLHQIQFRHKMTAGTTSATTFRVRAGAPSAGTTTLNGESGSAFFNGTLPSSITITEILP